MRLRPLAPDEVYASWGWIRNGLLAVLAKNDKAGFIPEDVYLRLRSGTAWAYTVGEDEIGFVILTQEHDPDGLVLFIWSLWLEPGSGAPVEDGIYGALEDLARNIKARRIRMHSSRKGWERSGFFDRICVVYEHEVT